MAEVKNSLSKAAVLVVGHGSSVNADSARSVYEQADELRRRALFSRVVEGFWKQEPFIKDSLGTISEPVVFIVPLFISEGYFTNRAIPELLGIREENPDNYQSVSKWGTQTIYYCKPIGTHPRITEVLLARAKKVVEDFPFPRKPATEKTSLFIAGHGTEKDKNSRAAIDEQVQKIRELNKYAEVHGVFIEEPPFIKDCYALATTGNIVMVPFFISDGMHTNEDLPEMLGQPKSVVQKRLTAGQSTWRNPTEKQNKLVWLTRSIGGEPLVADLILERIEEVSKVEQ